MVGTAIAAAGARATRCDHGPINNKPEVRRTLFPGDMPKRGCMIEYWRVWTGPPGRPAIVHDPRTNRITLWDLSTGTSLGGLNGCREIRAVSMDSCRSGSWNRHAAA